MAVGLNLTFKSDALPICNRTLIYQPTVIVNTSNYFKQICFFIQMSDKGNV